ncbi:adenylate cyclase class 2 [Nocardiopsis mwathae]|uniref:Adenylate cyclase class 2 n=1 Tax=Nocardiopsis mwathae TaxID=1472723 RepID=A0A7W9YKE6_9ACTN|nr:class IV adenylate cyclase [Nocardiopsis mwathae]MBB6173813.1 adenylate cyclase class 2 [Nocardiopsis mwathae]
MDLVEIERKREIGTAEESVRRHLSEAGWHASGPVVETDDYYSRPDVDFMETVECLRIRRNGASAEVTYEPPTTAVTHSAGDVIAKRETNVALGDGQADAAGRLLAALGMVHLVTVAKRRTLYRHPHTPGLTVAIDVVDNVGIFAEVEVLRSEAADGRELLEEIERGLGLTGFPAVDLPYRDLAMARSVRAWPAGLHLLSTGRPSQPSVDLGEVHRMIADIRCTSPRSTEEPLASPPQEA